MGSEFLKDTKKRIKKTVDKAKADLATPDLLSRTPENLSRRFVARFSESAMVSKGDRLIVETDGKKLVISSGTQKVGYISSPPDEIFEAVSRSGGVAGGEVHQTYKFSRTGDISLC